MEDHFILRWEMQLLALTSSTTMSKQHQSQPELQKAMKTQSVPPKDTLPFGSMATLGANPASGADA